MELLYEVRGFYDILLEKGILTERPDFRQIDEIADKIYEGDTSMLTQYIVSTLNSDVYNSLNEQLEKIKDVVIRDKKGN